MRRKEEASEQESEPGDGESPHLPTLRALWVHLGVQAKNLEELRSIPDIDLSVLWEPRFTSLHIE